MIEDGVRIVWSLQLFTYFGRGKNVDCVVVLQLPVLKVEVVHDNPSWNIHHFNHNKSSVQQMKFIKHYPICSCAFPRTIYLAIFVAGYHGRIIMPAPPLLPKVCFVFGRQSWDIMHAVRYIARRFCAGAAHCATFDITGFGGVAIRRDPSKKNCK